MSDQSNKRVVKRFFEECLDRGNVDIVDELFSKDCVIHRPEAADSLHGLDAIRNIVAGARDRYREMTTTLHLLIAEDDMVACRLSHVVVFNKNWATRLGTHDVGGKSVDWFANVFFRLRDGKIVEQWVVRDELGMHLKLGLIDADAAEN